MLKTSLSGVKRIGQMLVINGTLNRKVGSGRHRTSTVKLKMTVLKGIRKRLLSTPNIQNSKKKLFSQIEKIQKSEGNGIFIKSVWKNVFYGQQKIFLQDSHFKPHLIVEALGRPEQTFLFNMPLITNLCPILFTAKRDVFNISIFKIAKIHL